jgi:O-methyltransferase/methyltransferase family protein
MTRSLSVVHRKEAGLVVGADVYQQMNQMVTGHWVAQVVRAAVDLSLAEHLAVDGLTGDEVAERGSSAPATTSRLMRACVALGVLSADDHGRYFGTGLLATLHRDAPGSMRGLALATTLPTQWLSWNEFTTSVRTGRTQAAAALGSDFFEYLAEHRQQARDISAGMTTTTSLWTSDAAKVIDTDGVGLAVDVGGANGSLLHLLLDANPTLRGIVLDRPNIVEEAAAETAKRGLTDRADVIGGNFFESVPAADLYLLKMILHDWDDQRCITILDNCRKAIAPHRAHPYRLGPKRHRGDVRVAAAR